MLDRGSFDLGVMEEGMGERKSWLGFDGAESGDGRLKYT